RGLPRLGGREPAAAAPVRRADADGARAPELADLPADLARLRTAARARLRGRAGSAGGPRRGRAGRQRRHRQGLMALSTSPTRPGRTRGRGGSRARYDREQVLTAAAFLAPALIVIGIFVVYPIVAAGQLSLTSWDGFSPVKEFIGLDNYARLAADPEFWNSLLVTVVYAFGVCVLSAASGLAIALLLDAPLRGRGLYRSIYFLPAV